MDAILEFLKLPFTWGLAIGLLLFGLSVWGHFKTKLELKRYRKHLSDKLELEARQYESVRKDKDLLGKENENLRVRVQQLSEKSDQKVLRDLEIMARAEKRMMMQAPGFAGAWEMAKQQAADEVASEDAGKSLPKRLFNRLFGTGTVREVIAEQSTGTMGTADSASGHSNGSPNADPVSSAGDTRATAGTS
jgi:hypothetical protein